MSDERQDMESLSIPKDSLELIFEEANKKFLSINEVESFLEKKIFTFMSIVISVMGLSTTFFFKEYVYRNVDINLLMVSPYLVLIAGLGYSLFLLFDTVKTREYCSHSMSPRFFLQADKVFLSSKYVILDSFLLNMYDEAIKHNTKHVKVKGEIFNKSLSTVIGTIVVSITLFVHVFLIL